MFTEGSVYDPPRAEDGLRCLVMRMWPRGVAYERVDVWLKELGPETSLLRDLDARRIHWGQFTVSYLEGLRARPAARVALEQVRDLEVGGATVTLLCHEKTFPCHRFLLLDYLNSIKDAR